MDTIGSFQSSVEASLNPSIFHTVFTLDTVMRWMLCISRFSREPDPKSQLAFSWTNHGDFASGDGARFTTTSTAYDGTSLSRLYLVDFASGDGAMLTTTIPRYNRLTHSPLSHWDFASGVGAWLVTTSTGYDYCLLTAPLPTAFLLGFRIGRGGQAYDYDSTLQQTHTFTAFSLRFASGVGAMFTTTSTSYERSLLTDSLLTFFHCDSHRALVPCLRQHQPHTMAPRFRGSILWISHRAWVTGLQLRMHVRWNLAFTVQSSRHFASGVANRLATTDTGDDGTSRSLLNHMGISFSAVGVSRPSQHTAVNNSL